MNTPGEQLEGSAPTPRISSEQAADTLAKLSAEVTAEQRSREGETARIVAASSKKSKATARSRLWFVAQLPFLVVLPFVVLIGGAVWLYRAHAVPTWLALGCSGCVAALLLTLYGARLSQRLTGKARVRFVGTKLALPLVGFYCIYTLVFLSSVNAKTEDVKHYYRTVHPLLRVALSTVILFDQEIVVTDTQRNPDDYARMGLARLDNSLHFVQEDGYAHAVDLRTMGRAEWRNTLMSGFFQLMGFRTLRHVGTADHLHVSIAPPGDMRR